MEARCAGPTDSFCTPHFLLQGALHLRSGVLLYDQERIKLLHLAMT